MLKVGYKLHSLTFPPYFIRFMEETCPGGLNHLLLSLGNQQYLELVEFEKRFRVGFRHEQLNDLGNALGLYQHLVGEFPRFAFLIERHFEHLREALAAAAGPGRET